MSDMSRVDPKPGNHVNRKSRLDLTVVVTSTWGPSYLQECLESLNGQTAAAEVIVPWSGSQGPPQTLSGPRLTFLKCPSATAPPLMRYLAMRAARGGVVALTKDTCRVTNDWCSRIVALHREKDHEVIGGSVEFASLDNGPNWAAFLCEYSQLLPGALTGANLAGCNVSYKRRLLEENWDLFAGGEWESLIHWKLRRRGARFLPAPELVVRYRQIFRFREFLRQRYYFTRSLAEMRSRRSGWPERILRAAGSPLLPFLSFSRISRNAFSQPGWGRRLAMSLPWLIPSLVTGAAGELCGCLLDGDCSVRVK